jgi:1,4-alpha-glucan branching enzyme
LYRHQPALHELDTDPRGFEWIDCNDNSASTLSLVRKGKSSTQSVVVACNFTPIPRVGYRLGVPRGGFWRELLNSDAKEYGGGGMGNLGGVIAEEQPAHGRPYSLNLTLPPLAVVFLKAE